MILRPPMTAWGVQRPQTRQQKRAITSYNRVRQNVHVEREETNDDRPCSASSISRIDVILAQRLEEVLRAPHETMTRIGEHSDDDDDVEYFKNGWVYYECWSYYMQMQKLMCMNRRKWKWRNRNRQDVVWRMLASR